MFNGANTYTRLFCGATKMRDLALYGRKKSCARGFSYSLTTAHSDKGQPALEVTAYSAVGFVYSHQRPAQSLDL